MQDKLSFASLGRRAGASLVPISGVGTDVAPGLNQLDGIAVEQGRGRSCPLSWHAHQSHWGRKTNPANASVTHSEKQSEGVRITPYNYSLCIPRKLHVQYDARWLTGGSRGWVNLGEERPYRGFTLGMSQD